MLLVLGADLDEAGQPRGKSSEERIVFDSSLDLFGIEGLRV